MDILIGYKIKHDSAEKIVNYIYENRNTTKFIIHIEGMRSSKGYLGDP